MVSVTGVDVEVTSVEELAPIVVKVMTLCVGDTAWELAEQILKTFLEDASRAGCEQLE